MLVFFKSKIFSLDWLDMKMSNQFFIEFVNKIENMDFVTIHNIDKVTRLESQRNYFSDGSYNTKIDIELQLTLPSHASPFETDLGTAILFVNDNAYIFENSYINNCNYAISASTQQVVMIIVATNYAILNNNQSRVLEKFVETRKIDTSILTFDSTTNFFAK